MVYWPSRRAPGKQSQSPPAHPEAGCTNKANSPAGVRAGRRREAIAPNKPNLPRTGRKWRRASAESNAPNKPNLPPANQQAVAGAGCTNKPNLRVSG
jgi:hypothetical protein